MILNTILCLSHRSNAFTFNKAQRFQTNGPKTIEQRRRELDPDLWKQKSWVIEDPGDPTEVLYLKEREYHAYNRVALSNEMTLVLIARPTTSPDLIGPEGPPLKEGESRSTSSSASIPLSSAKRPYHTFSFKNSPLNIRALGAFFQVGTKDRLVAPSESNLKGFLTKYVRQTYFWVYGRLTVEQLRVSLAFLKDVKRILRHNGPTGLILRFKVSLIVITAFISGRPRQSTFDLGCFVALSSGLPKGLPRIVRDRIRKGDLNVIRVWLSIFNLYKCCVGGYGPIPLDTIQAPPLQTDISGLSHVFSSFFKFQTFIPRRLLNARDTLSWIGRHINLPRSVKAGPNEKISFQGAAADFVAWLSHPKGLAPLLYFLAPLNTTGVVKDTDYDNRKFYGVKEELGEDDIYDARERAHGPKRSLRPEGCPSLDRNDPRRNDPFFKVRDAFYSVIYRIADVVQPHYSTLISSHSVGLTPSWEEFKGNLESKDPKGYFGYQKPDKLKRSTARKRSPKAMFKYHLDVVQGYITSYSNPEGYQWGVDSRGKPRSHHLNPEEVLEFTSIALLKDINRTQPGRLSVFERLYVTVRRTRIYPEERLRLGKLSVIHEAAGKNRIIAINDYWSQCILFILHEYLFKILPWFSTDATFDQEGTLRRFTERNDIKYHASYDLSSATDLVPRTLYHLILVPIFGQEFSSRWLELLTDKTFTWTPSAETIKKVQRGNKKRPIATYRHKMLPLRYTRGQPMGAYSSWGLLAFAHHMVVQAAFILCAFKALLLEGEKSPFYQCLSVGARWELSHLDFLNFVRGPTELLDDPIKGPLSSVELITLLHKGVLIISSLIKHMFTSGLLPFDKYVLLGDDIVVGDKDTADMYYDLMNYTLGVPIKLAKSFVSSKGLINFANQTYLGKSNISPIPSKEAVGVGTISSMTEFARRITRRWSSNPYDILMKLRLMVKPSVYLHLVTVLAKGHVLLPVIPLCLHLNVSDATIGLNRSKAGRSNNPERAPYGVALGSIGHQLTNTFNTFSSIIKTTANDRTALEPERDQDYLDLFYVLVIRFIIKSFLHPFLGDARTSIFVDLDNAKRVVKKLQKTVTAYKKVKAKRDKYQSWYVSFLCSTPYIFDTYIVEMEAHLNLLYRVLEVDTLDLKGLSILLELIVSRFDPHIYRMMLDPDVRDNIGLVAAVNKGWRDLLTGLEKYQVRKVDLASPEEKESLLSMRFTKYLIRFSRLSHRTPYTLVDQTI
jgi:hypothetical protein